MGMRTRQPQADCCRSLGSDPDPTTVGQRDCSHQSQAYTCATLAARGSGTAESFKRPIHKADGKSKPLVQRILTWRFLRPRSRIVRIAGPITVPADCSTAPEPSSSWTKLSSGSYTATAARLVPS